MFKIPFLFGLEIDMLALVIFIFTMVVLTEMIKTIIRFVVQGSMNQKWFEQVIEQDGFKMMVAFISGLLCFYLLAKYGNKLPITNGTKIEISALTIVQYLLFTSLACGGYRLLKPVIKLWIETVKSKFLKKGE